MRAGARVPTDDRDRGAALLIAIGFVVMIGVITGGLAALMTTNVTDRMALSRLRDRQYAAEAAVNQEIVTVRQLPRTSAASCGTVSSLNSVSIRVDCAQGLTAVAGSDGTVLAQRNVVFSACVNTGSACTANAVLVRATVNFEQQYANGVTRTAVLSWSVLG